MFKAKFSSSDDGFDVDFNETTVTKGEDGFSPIIEVKKTSDGHLVTVTDAEGTQSFKVKNGEKGEKGDTGENGKDGPIGPQGNPGNTPIKGVDYFTVQDKEELCTEIESRITNSDWNAKEGQAGYIKNRTHYEETTVVNEPLNITWDGNTEGLVSVGDAFYKVSDLVLTDEQIKSGTIGLTNGNTFSFADDWDFMVSMGMVTEQFVVAPEGLMLFCREDGASAGGLVFPEKGVYFFKMGEDYTSSLTTTEPIEQTTVTIKKLDKKYLPDGCAGVTKVVQEPLSMEVTHSTGGYTNYDFPMVDLHEGQTVQLVVVCDGEKTYGGGGLYKGTGTTTVVATVRNYMNGFGEFIGYSLEFEDIETISYYGGSGTSRLDYQAMLHHIILNYNGEAKARIRINTKSTSAPTFKGSITIIIPTNKTAQDGITVWSSTAGSTKRFKITVDDNGTLTATELT